MTESLENKIESIVQSSLPEFDSLALSKLVFLIFAGFFTLFFRWYLTDNLSSGRIRFLAFIRQMNLTV